LQAVVKRELGIGRFDGYPFFKDAFEIEIVEQQSIFQVS